MGSLISLRKSPVTGPAAGSSGLGASAAARSVAQVILASASVVPNDYEKPLLAAPAWTANSALWGGSGCHCQNGGRLYWSPSGNYGEVLTSGAAFPAAPAQPWLPYVDNTISWYDMGPVPSAPSGAPANTTPTGVTFEAWGSIPANTTLYASTLATAAGAVSLLGGQWINDSAWGGAPAVTAKLDKAGTVGAGGMVGFKTNANVIYVSHEANMGKIAYTLPRVNGYWCETHTRMVPQDYMGRGGLTLTFGSSVDREILVPLASISGIRIPSSATISPLTSTFRLAVEGDSIMGGAAASNGGRSISRRVGDILGCLDVWNFAQGGTGFLNSGSGPTLIQRVQRVIDSAPDYLYIGGFNNDVGNDAVFNSSARRAAYIAYVKALRDAGLTNLIIDFGGVYNPSTARGPASHLQVEYDVIYAVQQMRAAGDSLVFFQRWKTDPRLNVNPNTDQRLNFTSAVVEEPVGGLVYGSGNSFTASPSVPGNASWMVGHNGDGLHPNARWGAFAARNIAEHILDVCRAILGNSPSVNL